MEYNDNYDENICQNIGTKIIENNDTNNNINNKLPLPDINIDLSKNLNDLSRYYREIYDPNEVFKSSKFNLQKFLGDLKVFTSLSNFNSYSVILSTKNFREKISKSPIFNIFNFSGINLYIFLI